MRARAVAFWLALTTSLGSFAALPASAAPGPPGGAAPAACRPSWNELSTPAPADLSSVLRGVAAISASDVWAAGSTITDPPAAPYQTLAEHWDGTGWAIVPSPNPGGTWSEFNAITAASSDDVWAVGDTLTGHTTDVLIEHWDGSAWSQVQGLNPSSDENVLYGAWSRTGNDAWAVGYQYTNGAPNGRTLVERWDGTAWHVVPSPNVAGASGLLYGVSGTSATDVWAVGQSVGASSEATLVEHWDGTKWSIVPAPSPSDPFVYLQGVSALSPSDAWAVGWYTDPKYRTILEHWDGTAWTEVAGAPSSADEHLSGVSAASADDVWAVGDRYVHGKDHTLVEHWDGTAWTEVSSRSSGRQTNWLGAVATLPDGRSFAVGAVGSLKNNSGHARSESICPVQALDRAFDPDAATAHQGQSVAWHVGNQDAGDHTITDVSGMGLFDSGERSPGGSYAFTFVAAGTYPYADTLSPGVTGEIDVPIVVSPSRGTPETRFVVTWASRAAGDPYVYDVQIGFCSSGPCAPHFENWRTSVTDRKAAFGSSDPAWQGVGTYVFRARVRNEANGHASGWSPPRSIEVRTVR